MIIGCLKVMLNIPAAHSLKDKRRVVKSLITRIHNRHNVSAAEVGENERHQSCLLGAAVVSNDSGHASQRLSAIINMIERESESYIVDYEIELL
ncbi:MAG: DUF503 domain-containing protein [Candidatus Zixiibacteriota bacterium]